MMRRAYITGIMALGLTASAAFTSPVFDRVVSSARSFRHQFQDLNKAGSSLSPIERFVFSLVVSNPATPQPDTHCSPSDRRT